MSNSFNPNPRLARHSNFQPTEPVQAQAVPPPRRSSGITTNIVLFVLTVMTVFGAGAVQVGGPLSWATLLHGWVFAVPLLAILVAHECGHYVAARVHGVPTSLPFFIPMPPFLSPLGTMGAVIAMRGRIASRKALLDVGASGPLVGMIIAVPVLIWGLQHSEVKPITGHGLLEGQCLLYSVLKRLTVGPIPDGYDVFLHPTAFAGWAGLLLTFINLLPFGQLDGGHIAYSLFGPIQNRIAQAVHWSMPAIFVVQTLLLAAPHWNAGPVPALTSAAGDSIHYLIWFALMFVLRLFGGRGHPPTEPGPLGAGRTAIAVLCFALFVLLFMPTPMSEY